MSWDNERISTNSENNYLVRKTNIFSYKSIDDKITFLYKNNILNLKYICNSKYQDKTIIDYKKLTISCVNLPILKDFVNECYCEYIDMKYKQYDTGKIKYYFNINLLEKDKKRSYSKYQLISNRTFENIFFQNKKEFLQSIDDFINKKGFYNKKYGLPNRFNILLAGKPGLGKTSIVKALSNMLDRHIINVDLNGIKTNDELIKLFFSEEIICNDFVDELKINVPFSKRIYLIEEIDTINITKTRKLDDKQEIAENIENSITQTIFKDKVETNDLKELIVKFLNKNALTLGSLLVLLDGVLELNDTILIMTTNHPEKLDPALIRQGRINFSLYLQI